MRRILGLSIVVLALLVPNVAQAQGASAYVVNGTGISAFGGIFEIAPNAALTMEGPGRDVGRDLAQHWVIYRWANAQRSSAQCEVTLVRFDHLGFNAEQPNQLKLVEKEVDRIKQFVAEPKSPWVQSSAEFIPWGRLTLIEMSSLRNDGVETLNVDALYVDGPYVYTISYLCNGAPLGELRELRAAIKARNITQTW